MLTSRTGFGRGDFPAALCRVTWVKLAAASAVRTCGHVVALEKLHIRFANGTPGSAPRMMRGTFAFYFQDAFRVQTLLPACATDNAKSFTCTLVDFRPKRSVLAMFFGERRDIAKALIRHCLDGDNELVAEFVHAREAQLSSPTI